MNSKQSLQLLQQCYT